MFQPPTAARLCSIRATPLLAFARMRFIQHASGNSCPLFQPALAVFLCYMYTQSATKYVVWRRPRARVRAGSFLPRFAPSLMRSCVSIGRAVILVGRFCVTKQIGCVPCHRPRIWSDEHESRVPLQTLTLALEQTHSSPSMLHNTPCQRGMSTLGLCLNHPSLIPVRFLIS